MSKLFATTQAHANYLNKKLANYTGLTVRDGRPWQMRVS